MPDEEKATVNHIGMQNFVSGNSITAEGIMVSCPGYETCVREARVKYYAPWTFYEEQTGRIFFAASDSVYEYFPKKNVVKRIAGVGEDETVVCIRSEQ